MPWAKIGYEQVQTIYPEALKKIGQKKMENPHIPQQEILIRTEVLRRDFTKRQLNILSMILSLSFYIGKEHARIPKMIDFEICGISKVKIKAELTQLVEMNVLEWNQAQNTFRIKDTREWEAKYHQGYNNQRAQELFLMNLRDTGLEI